MMEPLAVVCGRCLGMAAGHPREYVDCSEPVDCFVRLPVSPGATVTAEKRLWCGTGHNIMPDDEPPWEQCNDPSCECSDFSEHRVGAETEWVCSGCEHPLGQRGCGWVQLVREVV